MDFNTISAKATKKPHEVVITEILDQIEAGGLLPGENLPNEEVLASRLSISVTDVKNAYQTLEDEGLVKINLNSGAFLALTTRDLMLDRIRGSILHIDNCEIVQLLEIRESLEKLAIQQAIDYAHEADLKLIKEKLDLLEERVQTHRIATREDLEFHYSIAQASKNPILAEVMEVIFERFYQSLTVTRESIQRLERVDHFIDEHRKIYQAIVDRDKVKAFNLIHDHLERTIQLYPEACEYRG